MKVTSVEFEQLKKEVWKLYSQLMNSEPLGSISTGEVFSADFLYEMQNPAHINLPDEEVFKYLLNKMRNGEIDG